MDIRLQFINVITRSIVTITFSICWVIRAMERDIVKWDTFTFIVLFLLGADVTGLAVGGIKKRIQIKGVTP